MHVKCIYIYAHVSSMSSDSTERTEVFVTYAKIQMEKKRYLCLGFNTFFYEVYILKHEFSKH